MAALTAAARRPWSIEPRNRCPFPHCNYSSRTPRCHQVARLTDKHRLRWLHRRARFREWWTRRIKAGL